MFVEIRMYKLNSINCSWIKKTHYVYMFQIDEVQYYGAAIQRSQDKKEVTLMIRSLLKEIKQERRRIPSCETMI